MIPGAGEDLVGLPTEQERVGALVDLVEICRGLVVVLEERQGPSAALEPAPAVLIRSAESLHDSIDGDVRDGRQLHGPSFLSRWALSSHDRPAPAPTSSVAPGLSGRSIPHRVRTRPRSRADPCPAERTVRLSWVEQAARDRLTPHDPTVEQQPRLPDLRRSGSYSVPFASASKVLAFSSRDTSTSQASHRSGN